ncbi:putative sulfate exporter family transporter [Nocardioides sp.]|uniref:putative sulfate exporter family transporter n=1 Tax=Nocardioides sp. TaxID=35761 RepID=UPI00286A30ED|nr:putative sulfate exporter family transporter [Nocardioides sp.]
MSRHPNDGYCGGYDSTTLEGMAPLPRELPGLGLAAGGAALALGAHAVVPVLSPTLVAIVLGLAVAMTGATTGAAAAPALGPGLQMASRRLLRVGVALLGLQLVLSDVIGLGWPMLLVVAGVVGVGILGSLAIARLLGVPAETALLVAAGFSICGAAAVGAVQGVRRSRDETVAVVVSLVVVFGSVAMLLVPLLGSWLGLGAAATGAWAGASVHEVGQVVVAGGLVGGGALQVAVVVKLGRVLLLAPVLAVVSWRARTADVGVDGLRPPLVPFFVAAFVALVVVGSALPVPEPLLAAAGGVQSAALAAAMFALGCSLRPATLRRTAGPVVALAAGTTLLVLVLGLPAAFLTHR